MLVIRLRESVVALRFGSLMALLVLVGVGCGVESKTVSESKPVVTDVVEEHRTALDTYVDAADDTFAYGDATVVKKDGYTSYAYHMTSQTWLDTSKIDRTAWKHWVKLYVPDEITFSKALLFVNGGSNGRTEAPGPNDALALIAIQTKTIVVDVGQIPNQPFNFPDEPLEKYKNGGRGEDAFIAYCWDKFLKTSDPLWLPRLPMTKAVVRAMDLAQAEQPALDGFFIVGGSKRGWTTWTVAAVDDRVFGISPAVIDVLSVTESLENHFAAYGFWAPAVGNYEEMEIMPRMYTPEFAALCAVVDPISYVDRLTMPKYIVNSSGDQFFPPDSSKFYFDALQGEKHVRYMPNTDHGLNMEAYLNVASFYHALLTDTPRPEFTWKLAEDGALQVQCDSPPDKMLLWQAHNPEARDFRLESVGAVWKSTPVEVSSDGSYEVKPEIAPEGWTAFFVEVEFPNADFTMPFKFTTGISILPDTLPHARN